MSIQDDKPWWIPELTDAAWCARIREDYPEDAADSDDDTIRDEYADGWKYADTWDHLGDAREQFEQLADAYFALTAELAKEKHRADSWVKAAPELIAAKLREQRKRNTIMNAQKYATPNPHFALPPYRAEEFVPGGWAGVMNAHGVNCLTFTNKPGRVCTDIKTAQLLADRWNSAHKIPLDTQ